MSRHPLEPNTSPQHPLLQAVKNIDRAALGVSIYYQFSVSYTAKIMESLKTLAENRRHSIDLFFDERVSQLNTLAYPVSFDQHKQENFLDQVFTLMQTRVQTICGCRRAVLRPEGKWMNGGSLTLLVQQPMAKRFSLCPRTTLRSPPSRAMSVRSASRMRC